MVLNVEPLLEAAPVEVVAAGGHLGTRLERLINIYIYKIKELLGATLGLTKMY
jgi:hypothetical protein